MANQSEGMYSDEMYRDLKERAVSEAEDLQGGPEWCSLLPSWFVPRMATDQWCFGLLLPGGVVMVITHISNVTQAADGSIWLDVEMDEGDFWVDRVRNQGLTPLLSPTSRTTASVNAAQVIAAFEMADT